MELDILLQRKEPYQKPFFFLFHCPIEVNEAKKKKKVGLGAENHTLNQEKESSIHFFIR